MSDWGIRKDTGGKGRSRGASQCLRHFERNAHSPSFKPSPCSAGGTWRCRHGCCWYKRRWELPDHVFFVIDAHAVRRYSRWQALFRRRRRWCAFAVAVADGENKVPAITVVGERHAGARHDIGTRLGQVEVHCTIAVALEVAVDRAGCTALVVHAERARNQFVVTARCQDPVPCGSLPCLATRIGMLGTVAGPLDGGTGRGSRWQCPESCASSKSRKHCQDASRFHERSFQISSA